MRFEIPQRELRKIADKPWRSLATSSPIARWMGATPNDLCDELGTVPMLGLF
jgi:hypothetical protein